MALNGPGFFMVEDPESGQQFFTRDGRFMINAENELVTMSGHKVLDESESPVSIAGSEFYVDDYGGVFINGRHTTNLGIVNFENAPQCLRKRGDNLYELVQDIVPVRPENTSVHQKQLEGSNINIVEEMIEMIELNRTYESSQRALTAQDSTLAKLINQVPKFGA
jgi:flagellar basal-body rod protein FlgG